MRLSCAELLGAVLALSLAQTALLCWAQWASRQAARAIARHYHGLCVAAIADLHTAIERSHLDHLADATDRLSANCAALDRAQTRLSAALDHYPPEGS